MEYLYGVFKNHALEKVFDDEDAAVEYAEMRIKEDIADKWAEPAKTQSECRSVRTAHRRYEEPWWNYDIRRIAELPDDEVLLPDVEKFEKFL